MFFSLGTVTEAQNHIRLETQVNAGSLTVATLPASPFNGEIAVIHDASPNCGTGGGSAFAFCRWNGASWDTLATSASGGSGSPVGATNSTQYNAGGGAFGGAAPGTAGQVYESNGPSSPPSFQDPIVSGPDAPGVAPTKNPVQEGLFDGTNVQRAKSDTSGNAEVVFPSAQHVIVDTAPTTAVTGSFFQATQPISSLQLPAALDGSGFLKTHEQGTAAISAASLPLPSGAATAAKQPALGTAGTPSVDVITVQGKSGMTPVVVDGSGVTQPISATALPLPSGASTAAKQPALGTAGTPSADVISIQGKSGMTPVVVDGSATTQPVSGSVTVVQPTGTNLHTVCDSGCSSSAGFADNGAFTAGTTSINPVGGLFDDTPPTAIATGHAASARITPNRALHMNLRNQAGTEIGTSSTPVRTDPTGTTTQPISAASLPLPASASTDASVTNTQVAGGATTAPTKVQMVGGKTNDGTPQYDVMPEGAGGRSVIIEGVAGGTAVPISAAALPLPSGAAADSSLTTLDTDVKANITLHSGTAVIGHVINDSGSTTVVTGNVAVTKADGSDVTMGAKADAKSTATDTTAISMMQVLKEISAMAQAPATTPVTGTFFQATQPIAGTLSDNNAAPSTNNEAEMPCMARTDLRGGTAATAGRLIFTDCGTDGSLHVSIIPDLSLKRYRASSKFAASSTTDNWRISGNASNTVIVTKLTVTCTETTAAQVSVQLIKRSTAGSGGTAATVTAVPLDSNKAAASSVVNSYTGTGPTVGTIVGNIDDAQFGCMAAATATPNDIYIPSTSPGAPIAVLRTAAEGIALNFGGALTGGNLTVSVEWTEVTTITP